MLLHIFEIPLVILEVLVVFNLMIVVHELGHFLAAKWRGLVIEKFGIWFGKPLWKKKINGVEYSFGTIPFGGFVALPQMAPMEVMEGSTETPRENLPPVSALDKIIVAFAGPLFSFGLALALATLVWLVGRPVSEGEATQIIGAIRPGSPAEKAGLKIGDKIISVDGHQVHRFGGMGSDSISWQIISSEGDTIPVTVQRVVDGKTETLTLDPKPEVEQTKPWMRKALREIGIEGAQHPMVAKVEPGSAAQKAGLKPSDLILDINGAPAYSLDAISAYINQHPGEQYTLTVERGKETITVPFTPGGVRVDTVSQDSPASRGGIKEGDTILALDGKELCGIDAKTDYIQAHGGKAIDFTIQNPKGEIRKSLITPEIAVNDPDKIPRVGLAWDPAQFGIIEDASGKFKILKPDPVEQIRSGFMTIVDTVGAIASAKSNVKLQHMGGPLMMFRVYYMLFQSREGLRLALWFSVVLNVNLALLNLLPIPVLDGGHITLALVEAIRRRPVNGRFLEVLQTGCAVLIIGFMLYIAFFDVQDYVGEKPDRLHFEQKDGAAAQSQQ
ncbi:MAG TPA: site-2 protease family protein [Chthoniobacteraceae bacterium]|jgi:regulator of sigma E protease|nr:site-2 protease family protein [Chthoniobacteraceae bacterium]